MNIISWNCRGVVNPSFLNNFHSLVRKHNPDFFCILETRIFGDSINKLHRRVGYQWQMFAILFEGLFGGVIVLWKKIELY